VDRGGGATARGGNGGEGGVEYVVSGMRSQ
jgi:hypothetical protein